MMKKQQTKGKVKVEELPSKWVKLPHFTDLGLSVQKVIVRGKPVYDVVRTEAVIASVNPDVSRFVVYDANTGEEINPIIVCHASYQKINEV
jgi:hypothetical protein